MPFVGVAAIVSFQSGTRRYHEETAATPRYAMAQIVRWSRLGCDSCRGGIPAIIYETIVYKMSHRFGLARKAARGHDEGKMSRYPGKLEK